MFHATWPVGHNSTEYDRYYTAQPGEIYKVTRYQSAYEPYIIYKKEGPPWYIILSIHLLLFQQCCRCDERFVGYGGNKAACHFEMRLSGMSYYVLADHFLVHQNHLYEEVARKNEVISFSVFKSNTYRRIHDYSVNTIARFTTISRKKHAFGAFNRGDFVGLEPTSL